MELRSTTLSKMRRAAVGGVVIAGVLTIGAVGAHAITDDGDTPVSNEDPVVVTPEPTDPATSPAIGELPPGAEPAPTPPTDLWEDGCPGCGLG